MNPQEHQAQGNKQQAQAEERQAHGDEEQLKMNQIRKLNRGIELVHPIPVKRHLETKIYGLETSLVCHFTDRQQNLAGDIALLKSQVAEMVECLKEMCDAKKEEGTSSKKRRLL
ncbi:hypothetical protein F511_35847 [Dorcoceras hygrometricum]|uniref:Uncharacterized protein n=1 Tax=Dorcoceras hygrometricum TaxID=472368 RepID=A0A2Z7CYN8_9LAMI|nr:hypothetical protein F511_35847 [Dorcoceras hygrometricum]